MWLYIETVSMYINSFKTTQYYYRPTCFIDWFRFRRLSWNNTQEVVYMYVHLSQIMMLTCSKLGAVKKNWKNMKIYGVNWYQASEHILLNFWTVNLSLYTAKKSFYRGKRNLLLSRYSQQREKCHLIRLATKWMFVGANPIRSVPKKDTRTLQTGADWDKSWPPSFYLLFRSTASYPLPFSNLHGPRGP